MFLPFNLRKDDTVLYGFTNPLIWTRNKNRFNDYGAISKRFIIHGASLVSTEAERESSSNFWHSCTGTKNQKSTQLKFYNCFKIKFEFDINIKKYKQ